MHLSKVSGERLGKVLSRLARQGLILQESNGGNVKPKKKQFPTFDVSPNAPIIPASRIQRAIDEEGLF
jgi:hypothetical protein